MYEFIAVGILLFLAWLFIYFKYFKKHGNSTAVPGAEPVTDGEKYYSVAPWGDDKNSGGIDDPWHTLQYSVNRLGPGDTLLIRGGTYREYLTMKQSGTTGNPIVVRVFQGEEAEINGDGVGWKYGFNLESGVSYVTLSGLRVKNFAAYGFALWGDNKEIRLTDLEAYSCGTGLRIISATDLLIEGCGFYNNNAGMVISPGPAIKARIERTRSNGSEGPGITDGFVLDSGKDIVIEKCCAEFNAGNGFNCQTSDTIISSSVSRANGAYGIKCSGEYELANCIMDSNGLAGAYLHRGGRYELYNNLVVKCGFKGDFGLTAVCEANPSTVRVTMVNNILAYNYGGVYLSGAAVLEKEDHNIFWSREDAEIATSNYSYGRNEINGLVWFKESGRGEHSFCRDPLFVDPDNHDFRLAKNSPAIDRGLGEGAPAKDINGSIRPQGKGYDIGPYESAEGSIAPPFAEITSCPGYSTDISDCLKFTVKWDGSTTGGIMKGYRVQVRDGVNGTWHNWLAETTTCEDVFLGASGRTYYFRVRARDDLGNWGDWSGQQYTVVPTDDRSPLIKYEGAWETASIEGAFLNTVHRSQAPGASASLRFTGAEVAWISGTGPDMGQARVLIDGVAQTTVDLYSESNKLRCTVFTAQLDNKPHTISIQVFGTKNEQSAGAWVELDGIAVRQ
ncbi:MAG: right-handed parallel beta-helix repeat-containing protein [Desulfotomaculaceae bacterium]